MMNYDSQRHISNLAKFRLLSHNVGDYLRTNRVAVTSLWKTVRSSLLSFLFSLCLLFTIPSGNAGASQGLASQPRTASRKSALTTSNLKTSERQQQETLSNAHTQNVKDKRMSKVEVEFVVAEADVTKTPSVTKEKKTVRIAKEINRKSKEVEKSLSKDLFEFEKEAEQEVKQSWNSLTGSMKGTIRTTDWIVGSHVLIDLFPRNLSDYKL
jgi:hypothetical protein